MTITKKLQVLAAHGIEVWHGYAVSVSVGDNVTAESFIEIGSITNIYQWLGY